MINIRKMNEEDIPVVVSFLDGTTEDFLHQWGGGRWYDYPVTAAQMTKLFHTKNENTLYFLILDDEEIIGSFEIDYIDWEKRYCSVCRYLIKDGCRSRGYGTQALKIIVKYLFNEFNMVKVTLSVYDFNVGAYKCYLKVGFKEYNRSVRDNGWVAIEMEIHNPENEMFLKEC